MVSNLLQLKFGLRKIKVDQVVKKLMDIFNTFSMEKLLIFEENIILILHMFIICHIYFKQYQFACKGFGVKGACVEKNYCFEG